MPGALVSIDAWNRRAAARETVRVGSALNSVTLGADGFIWEPAMRRAPRLSMQLVDPDFTGAVQIGQAQLSINAKALTRVADWRDLDWIGSTVRIYSGDSPFLSSMGTELIGRIYGGVTDAETGIAQLSLEADRAIVDVPLLTRTYAGTGGIEGDPEMRGNFKPAGWGSPVNVPPVLINAALFIYQADAYGSLMGFAGVYEDLASFGPATQDYPTYEALATASLTGGQWATCTLLGLFRLGAQPTGTITCDPVCGSNQPGDMMVRWLVTHAGVPLNRIRIDTFAALNGALYGLLGNQTPRVSFWTTDEGNVLDLMQRMCASCNASPLLLLDGTVAVSRVIGGGVAVTLQRQGGTPPVTGWLRQEPTVPWWRMRMTAARSYYVNGPAEIDYEDEIRLMGGYSPTETYRQGMVVIGADGAQYIFINPTATKGVAPPNSSYWDLYANAPDATQIKYPSGFTLADKEPAEKDATSGAPAGTTVGGVLAELLIGNVERIAADEWLSTAEKPQAILAYNSLTSNWESLDARYRSIGSPADITTSWQNASTSMYALDQYLAGLRPGWSDVNYDTRIVPSDYRDRWSTAYKAVAALNAAITGRKGDKGADGMSITVTAAPQTIRYDKDDVIVSGPVTFTAVLSNAVGPVSWASVVGHGLYNTPGVSFSGNSMTITAERIRDVLAYNQVYVGISYETIVASASGISAQVSVQKVRDGATGASAPLVRTQWSIDGSTNWHDNYFGGDIYYRQSNDGGNTFGPAIRGVGENGTIGADGIATSSVFTRSATVPARPQDNSGDPPPGWSDGPPGGTDILWLSVARFKAGVQQTGWSYPERITGEKGDRGSDSVVPGPPGRPAITFRQDATPVGAQEGDGWVTVTPPKIFRQLVGGSWTPMLGAVAGFDKLIASYIDVESLSALSANIGFLVSYNGQGGRVERDGNGTRIYDNNGILRDWSGF